MLRNLSRTILMAAAAWFAAASVLSAQQPGTDPLRGDVDGDGAVTAADARIVADYVVGKPVPAGANVRDRGDVNGDGRITSVDAAIIRGFVAGRANVGRFKVGTPAGEPASALARVRCRVDARTATMTCGGPADQPGGARSSITLTYGGQGEFVTLASTPGVATPYSGGDSVEVTSDVTVRNLLPQKIGTTDGVENDSVRVFFSMAPTTTSGSGTVTVDGSGVGTFTASNQRYYSYAGPIDTQAVSLPRQWRFKMPATVAVFDFELLIDAEVQYNGWVDLYPPYHKPSPYLVPVDTLMPGETLQLVDSVRSAKGFHLPGVPVSNWSSNNPAAATVSNSGFVTAVDVGTTTVTATAAGSRTGQVSIVVARPDTAVSTITATPGTVTVGDSATVTVQLKYTSGGNVPRSGGTVALAVTGAATLTAVTDNNDGTYTAKVTSNSAEAVTISGTLDGHNIVSTAGVTFQAGAASGMAANSATPQSATVGTAVTAPPSVKVTDSHGNGVAGVAVTFTVTTGSGQVSNGTDPAGASAVVTTNASGVATLASWTLGTAAGAANNSVTASATGLADVVFTATATVGAAANMAAASATTQSAEVGTAVAAPPSVTVTDQYGNVVAGYTVTFTVAAGGGQVSNGTDPAGASAAVVTNVSGVATLASWTVGTAVGTDNNTVTASGTGVTDVGFTASGTPGAVHHFVVEAAAGGPIGDQLAGAAFNVKVTAQDEFNNTATGFTGTVDFTTTPPGGITAGGTSAAFTAGVLSSHAVTIGTAGDYTLTATRTGGTEAGTSNSFQVQQAPTSVADGPTPTSVPGDPFHAAFNTALGANNVMTNDTRGLPLANVTSFGGGSAGGDITTNAPGAVVNLGNGGSLSVAADGAVTFTPSTGFTGLFTFQYRITNVRGTSDAQVTIAVGFRPAVTPDDYPTNLIGNVPINTATPGGTGFKVTTNDVGDAKVLTPGPATNGTVLLNADGTFTFTPAVGFTGGNATFTYTVTNGFGTTDPATVTLPVSGIAWFVNTTADGGNDGRYGSAFDNLNTAFPAGAGKPAANQPIFVYSGSYTGGVTLSGGQTLLGQGASGTFNDALGLTWPADAGPAPSLGGTRPTVTGGLTLNSNNTGNTLRGFDLTGSATALAGTNFGTLTVSEVGINTSGAALNLNNGTLAGTGFTQLSSSGAPSGGNNVTLTSVSTSGSPALGTNADALSGATGSGFVVSGGNGSFTYLGTIANTAGLAVNVSGKTGGTVAFPNDINPVAAGRGISVANNTGSTVVNFSGTNQKISSGANTGVSLTNNGSSGGATVNFTGGNLVISTTSASGFVATGGGTVSVTGAGNTINVTAGSGSVALNVQNTAISGGVLNFKSIASTGGTSGIVLNNTSGGGLTVPGDGASDAANTTRGRTTAKSGGGTVTLGSGGTISGTSGDGITLTSTGAVTLRNMVIQNGSVDGIDASTVSALTVDNTLITGHANGHGIRGSTLSGLSLTHSDVGNNATAAGVDASDTWNMRFLGLTGTGTVQNSKIHHSAETVFGVINTSGSLTLGITNTNITDTYPVGGSVSLAPGTNGLQINAYGSSVINATLTNDSIARTRARGVTASTETAGSGSLSLTVTGTKFADNVTVGLEVAHGSSGTATYTFDGNDFQRHGSIPINVNRLGSSSFASFGNFTGTIQNNTIGTAGVLNSGTSTSADGIHVESNGTGGNTRVAIVNNTIRQVGQYGIYLGIVDTKIGGAAQPALEARVQGNNVSEIKTTGLDGLRVVPGGLSGDHGRVCLDVISNTLVGSSGAGPAYGWRIRTSALLAPQINPTPTIQLKGWNGSDAFATYAVNRPNTLSGVSGTATESHAGGSLAAVASCNTP